jgi:uncharacterized membrane protein YjdF
VPEVLKFDQLAHFGISAVVTVAVFQLVGQIVDPRAAGPWVRATFAALVCAGFGAANELFEFLSALRFEDSFAGDLTNAGWDLAFNTGGAATAAIACALLASPRVAGSPSRVVSTRRAHCNSEPGSVTVVRTAPGS